MTPGCASAGSGDRYPRIVAGIAARPAVVEALAAVDEIERTTIRTVALLLLPLVFLLYLLSLIDRVNLGFAALTMNKDLDRAAAVPEPRGDGRGDRADQLLCQFRRDLRAGGDRLAEDDDRQFFGWAVLRRDGDAGRGGDLLCATQRDSQRGDGCRGGGVTRG
jgi:hypothetical protein